MFQVHVGIIVATAMSRYRIPVVLACLAMTLSMEVAQARQTIQANVQLNCAVTNDVLTDLGRLGQVLDTMPEINAVTLQIKNSDLPTVRALPYVAGASPDAGRRLSAGDGSDFSSGATLWNLDAINVTDFEIGRVVDYTGEGVYIAVIDSGLIDDWRAYFPEDRIATQFARGFGGGGGDRGTVSEQPDKW